MNAEFISNSFRFRFEPIFWEDAKSQGLTTELEDGFDHHLTESGKIPELYGAPITSWFFARLKYLTGGVLRLDHLLEIDGGDFNIGCVVYRIASDWKTEAAKNGQGFLFDMVEFEPPPRSDQLLANLEFWCGEEGIGIVGLHLPEIDMEDIIQAFVDSLLSEPNRLYKCEIRIYDPDWRLDPTDYVPKPKKSSRNEYGWNGYQFLGAFNIRPKRD